MERWVAIFEDITKSEARPIRMAQEKAHNDFLAENRNEIVLAGGLWILEVPNKAR